MIGKKILWLTDRISECSFEMQLKEENKELTIITSSYIKPMLGEDNHKLEAECKRQTTARHSREKSGVIPSQYVADYRLKNVLPRRSAATSGGRSMSAIEVRKIVQRHVHFRPWGT